MWGHRVTVENGEVRKSHEIGCAECKLILIWLIRRGGSWGVFGRKLGGSHYYFYFDRY